MGCCGKPGGCPKQNKDVLSSSFFDMATDLSTKLLELANSGLRANVILRRFGFVNNTFETLAKRIAELAIENEYLRKITCLVSPISFNVAGEQVEIFFGPQKTYLLKIPCNTKHERNSIVAQLRAAADEIEAAGKKQDNSQKLFPFANN